MPNQNKLGVTGERNRTYVPIETYSIPCFKAFIKRTYVPIDLGHCLGLKFGLPILSFYPMGSFVLRSKRVTQKLLCIAPVRPHLSYTSQVWSPSC